MNPTSYAPKTPPATAARMPETSLSVLVIAMSLLILPVVAICQFIAYWRVDVVDDQMFGYFGWRIAHGATVYLDVWDNKPPGIYWINALGFLIGNDSYVGVIVLCILALLIAHACFFGIGLSLWSRGASAVATVLLSFYLTHGYYTGGTNRTETFLVACELSAVLLYLRGFARDAWWKWFIPGVLCGLAFTFKQVGLAAWGAMGLHLIFLGITRELPWGQALRRGGLLVAGTLSLLAVVIAFLSWQGALNEAVFATFGFNRSYFATGTSQFPYSFMSRKLLEHHLMPIMKLPLLMGITAAIHAVLWALRPTYRPQDVEKPLKRQQPVVTHTMFLFSIWTVAAFYGALISPHGFRHYLVPAIPPLLLMGGHLVNVLLVERNLLERMQQRAWVAAAFVAMGYFAYDAGKYQLREVSNVFVFRFSDEKFARLSRAGFIGAIGEMFSHSEVRPAEWERIGEAVRRHSGPADKIQCWGYLPGVYLDARRINVCRFTTTEKVGQVGKEANFVMKELQEKLASDPPAILVLKAEDYFWMRGEDTSKPPPAVDLTAWLSANYERVEEVAPPNEALNAYIYKRKDLIERK